LSRLKLIKQLKKRNLKHSQSELETVIDLFSNNIAKALKQGKKVELRGFGTFFVKKIKEKYSARNPKTGELIYVPEKNKVRFRASKNLKKKINEKI
jgi:integration host factor subunit beta|tara:strand:- start:368 stop:655 length:288 start_codon:yes stop_codon:yes gene_type:complete